jgi:hypothetical protein
MKRKQMVYQKIILLITLVLVGAVFMFSLGFATNLYSLKYHADESSSMLYVEGAELYYSVQPFNRQLLGDSAILLILCILMFATLTHRRRLYYASNYITTSAFCAFSAYYGATLIVNALYIKQLYIVIDFDKMKEITDMLSLRFVNSSFMLNLGVVLSVLLIAISVALIANLVWKTINMRKEKRKIGGVEA